MPERRWIVVAVAVAVVVALVASFAIGRSTAGDAAPEAADDASAATTAPATPTLPEYGDATARASYVSAVNGSLSAGPAPTDEELLAAGDSLCADLEGFTVQGRDAHYAIRILWTDQVRYLDTAEVALFGVVLAAAPKYLCPQYRPLALDVAYWLGI